MIPYLDITRLLKKEGIQVLKTQAIRSGLNSRVYKVISRDKQSYALKFYKVPTIADPRNRLKAEIDFLNYIQKTNARSATPRLVTANIEENWSLLSWLNGEPIEQINAEHLRQITDFISNINAVKDIKKCGLQVASEACIDHATVSRNLDSRLKKLENIDPVSDLGIEVSQWIRDVLLPCSKKVLNNFEESRHKSIWRTSASSMIASPSDVGAHNTLIHKTKLFFFDFEYAGLDDIAKLACDWVLQPRQPLSAENEVYLIQQLTDKIGFINKCWTLRYSELKPIMHLKWCTIMLNKHLNNTINFDQFLKVKRYFGDIGGYSLSP